MPEFYYGTLRGKMEIKKILTNARVIVLLIALIFALVAIHPNPWNEGVAIRAVQSNSSASLGGIESPKPTAPPMSREVIQAIDNIPIKDMQGYYQVLSGLKENRTATIQTNKYVYNVRVQGDLGLSVYDAPRSNIRQGLDLQGGTRVLLQPEARLSQEDMDTLIEGMRQRLNVYGLSDLTIRESDDLPPPLGTGNQYVVVEIAGATKEEVQNLIAQQGKFDAKIGNETVFSGGSDITSVCRSADCSGIDPNYGCQQQADQIFCRFRFSITLSQESAQRQADATSTLAIITQDNSQYLEKPLELYLDDVKVDQLNIGSDLKGRAVTDIQISGTGQGISRQEAALNALQQMKRLQTLLITGSLPVKIKVIKIDTTSPLLGHEFVKNTLFTGLIAIISVALVLYFAYRSVKVSFAILVTMILEIVLLLGLAALIGWNIDLAGIAGILVAVGTGVDDQIVITSETMKGQNEALDWKKRFKRAFFIIMGSYFTTVVAMLPLVFAGAGLLKGFAITTILGVSIGVFITRPAFAALIQFLVKE